MRRPVTRLPYARRAVPLLVLGLADPSVGGAQQLQGELLEAASGVMMVWTSR